MKQVKSDELIRTLESAEKICGGPVPVTIMLDDDEITPFVAVKVWDEGRPSAIILVDEETHKKHRSGDDCYNE